MIQVADKIFQMRCFIEGLIENAFEEEGESQLDSDYELPLPLGVADELLRMLKSSVIREPLEDVVFFAGKPTLDSMVYHVLCRKETYEQMRHDPNIHFMCMKLFNGVFDPDLKTLDEQETANRQMLAGTTEGR